MLYDTCICDTCEYMFFILFVIGTIITYTLTNMYVLYVIDIRGGGRGYSGL